MAKTPTLKDLILNVINCRGDWEQSHFDSHWVGLIRAYEDKTTVCDWCCLDYIGTITLPEMIPFFRKLAYSGRDWYSRELAIHWLKNNYPNAIENTDFSQISYELLVQHYGKNTHDDKQMQRVSLTGIRYFGTDEAKAKVWRLVYMKSPSLQAELLKEFEELVQEVLKNSEYDISRHIIITPPTLNNYYDGTDY